MSTQISLKTLIPTHNRLRNPSKIKFMDDAFDSKIKLTRVRKVGSYIYYIHDGHHRCIYHILSGKSTINVDQVEIQDRKESEYNEFNFDLGYVTPFNPVSEVRHPDFFLFKKNVLSMSEYLSHEYVMEYVIKNKYRYCEPRVVVNLEDMFINYLRGH